MKMKNNGPEIKKSGRRSTCPIAGTLDIIGDKWSLLIIRDIYYFGKSRYDEFLSSPEKISTNILADRLKKLEENKILVKSQYSTHSQRMSYELTGAGKSLAKVLREIADWGLENLPGTISRRK